MMKPNARAILSAFVTAYGLAVLAVFTALAMHAALAALSTADGPFVERAFADEASAEASSDSSASADSESSSQNPTSVDGLDTNIVDPTQRADNSFIYDTTIEDILSEPSSKEGQTVQFTGEAIGDAVSEAPLDGAVWVMVASTTEGIEGGISVLMSAEQANQIDHFGRYGVTGTIVQVRGVFHQACPEHEGLLDLHATNVAVVTKGVEHRDTFNPRNFGPGLLAVIIGFALMAGFYFARERLR